MRRYNSFLIKIGILIVFSILINNFFVFSVNGSERVPAWNTYLNSYNLNLKSSKTSGKIYINGNAGWKNAKVAGICKGEGTYSNPYIIENLIIGAGGYGSCILIENSDVFFRIEGCTVSNSGYNWIDGDAGIKLSNVQNSLIIKNHCLENGYRGIYLINSNNNTILGNNVNYNDEDGICLEYSDHNIISENVVYHNYRGGITLRYSNYNKIWGNTANSHDIDGIYLYYSNNNMILRNTAKENFNKGIRLSHSNNNIVIGNTALLNFGGGVREYNCKGNIIFNNFSTLNIMIIFLIISIIIPILIYMILIYKNKKRLEKV